MASSGSRLADYAYIVSETEAGLAQGGANVVNGVQDVAVGLINLPANIANGVANAVDWATGNTSSDRIRIPTLESPDWSRDLFTHEAVPLGARVPTKNPNRFDYDDSLPEPDEATWSQLSITVHRSDGGVIDMEMIRPTEWIEANGVRAGRTLPMHIDELQVNGIATVTAVAPCPPIANGEGSVVTAQFITRQVDEIVTLTVTDREGRSETLQGTPIHPIWSVDREGWVPMAELREGETLQGEHGLATVTAIDLAKHFVPVYNIEVHGEHVYQIGDSGVLVHNACDEVVTLARGELGIGFMTNSGKLLGRITKNLSGGHPEHVLTIQNAKALADAKQAFGFTVARASDGTLSVFGSGAFPHVSGMIPQNLKNVIIGLVD